jgi:protein-L-isoaspartate(D-aspartate) O-methyltransferase
MRISNSEPNNIPARPAGGSNGADPNQSDYLFQRQQMVEIQLAGRGIKDERVINAFLKIPRHLFVDEPNIKQAYEDNPLPIGCNQTISQPYMVAFMIEQLNLHNNHNVLEIGTGSGYQTALLAELSREVYTVDRMPELAQTAQKRLELLGYRSIHYKTGDGTLGWEEFAPFDRIIISAGSPRVPNELIKQLSANNGILLCPVGNKFSQDLIRVIKRNDHIEQNNLGSCVFVKLVGAEGWKE